MHSFTGWPNWPRDLPFKIDHDFQNMLPDCPPSKELEKDLVATGGPINPLIVWDEQNILIDGHRRLRVCLNKDLPYTVVRESHPNRTAVEQRIRRLYLSTRQRSPHEDALIRGQYMIAAGKSVKQAANILSRESGKSNRTQYRALEYAKAHECLTDDWKGAISDVAGENIHKTIQLKYVKKIAKLSREEQNELYALYLQIGKNALLERFRNDPQPKPVEKLPESVPSALPEASAEKSEEEREELYQTPKRDRIVQQIKEVGKAGGKFHREVVKLFGPDYMDAESSGWKRRFDAAYHSMLTVFEEIEERQREKVRARKGR